MASSAMELNAQKNKRKTNAATIFAHYVAFHTWFIFMLKL